MKSLISYLECGRYQKKPGGVGTYSVSKFKDIYEKVIPFFSKYHIIGIKSKDFMDWCKAAEIIRSKAHLTKEGVEEVSKIKGGMNNKRIINEGS
jgi:hypothetical protein